MFHSMVMTHKSWLNRFMGNYVIILYNHITFAHLVKILETYFGENLIYA